MNPWPLADRSVNCIVTSPPYWALRDYGVEGQIGLEKTPEEYIAKMVEIFREAYRVLRNDGTLWVNIGDSYASSGKNITKKQASEKSNLKGGMSTQLASLRQQSKIVGDLKAKDLVGIPWMLAFALRADGWYLRQDIIWSKPNAMPESVTDRCTRSHEYIFMFSKSKNYYYDYKSIKTSPAKSSISRWNQNIDDQTRSDRVPGKTNGTMKAVGGPRKTDKQRGHTRRHAGFNDRWDKMTREEQQSLGANKRSVWHVATAAYKEAHFATFPPNLIEDCIKAGCIKKGIVLDPFMGSGTTGLVSASLHRKYIGFDLNPEYIKMAEERIKNKLMPKPKREIEISQPPKGYVELRLF